MKTLDGKVALVTGGSRGIGAAVVRRFAADGAAVAFTYAASDAAANALMREVEGAGATAIAIKADSGDEVAIRGAISRVVDRFGRIDILVNNAGILKLGVIDDFALVDFDRMWRVNVRAAFVAIQAALAHMGRGGRIVTTGSVSADRAGFAGSSVYGMTKAAIAGLSRGLARDLGPRGITVNVVQPGPTETDMTDDDAMRTALRPLLAVGRMGTDTEVASMVAYLASPQAGFVTGAAVTVDGGYLA